MLIDMLIDKAYHMSFGSGTESALFPAAYNGGFGQSLCSSWFTASAGYNTTVSKAINGI
jgi:hypothetical protein